MTKTFFGEVNKMRAKNALAFTLGSILTMLLTFGILSLCQAAEVTLAWDPNEPAPDGYRIYQRSEGQSYDYSQPVWEGPGTTGTIEKLDGNTSYYFIVRAYAGTRESLDSEEVSYTPPAPPGRTIIYSTAKDRSGSIPLQDATVSGEIFVFTSREAGIETVAFYIDDPDMTSDPIHIEKFAPFDLSGGDADNNANPYDTALLPDGHHRVTILTTLADGTTETDTALFRVVNTPPESPGNIAFIDPSFVAGGIRITIEQQQADGSWSPLAVSSPVPDTPGVDFPYRGNPDSRIYHQPGCRYFDGAGTGFGSREAADAAGYRPCKVCMPSTDSIP